MSGGILGCHKWGEGWCCWHLVVDMPSSRDAAKHPTMLKAAPHNNELSAKMSVMLRL